MPLRSLAAAVQWGKGQNNGSDLLFQDLTSKMFGAAPEIAAVVEMRLSGREGTTFIKHTTKGLIVDLP